MAKGKRQVKTTQRRKKAKRSVSQKNKRLAKRPEVIISVGETETPDSLARKLLTTKLYRDNL